MVTRKRTSGGDRVSKEWQNSRLKVVNPKAKPHSSICTSLMKITVAVLSISVVLVTLSIILSPISPEAYTVPAPPPFNSNRLLMSAKRILENEIAGPESIVQYKDSLIFGLTNGTVMNLFPDGKIKHLPQIGKGNCNSFEAEHECGRPLGMRVHEDNLYVIDAYLGMFRYNLENSSASAVKIVAEMTFGNDLVVASDGTIYFTCSSRRWQRRYFPMLVLEQISDGYLAVLYKNGTTKILHDKISFANGIEIAPDESYILIAVTNRAQILKHWLTGPKAGDTELLTFLPGLPDNIAINPRGNFWVGISAVRTQRFPHSIVDLFSGKPTAFRRMAATLLTIWPSLRERIVVKYGLALEIDGKTGTTLRELHDPTGLVVPGVSHVLETADGTLYFGSFDLPYLSVLT